MKEHTLYEFIKYLQKGSDLHIGVLFFGNYGNNMCDLPHEKRIHNSAVCNIIKGHSVNDYKRCLKCRSIALKKALREKTPFFGACINNICEYTHPVVINNEVAFIIYIGNIFNSNDNPRKIPDYICSNPALMDSLEKNYTCDDCVIMAELLEGYIRMLLSKHPSDSSGTNPLINNIKNYIDSNLESNITISHISDIFHYNKMYIGRIFKSATSMSIKEYINSQRVKRAFELLSNSNKSIIDISYEIGFNNVTYFNKVFKAISGLTPSQYRYNCFLKK